LPGEHGRERPPAGIYGGDEEIRQQRKEIAMLLWHEASDAGSVPTPARACLSVEFVGMKRRKVHRHLEEKAVACAFRQV
jgi:hypothetical protein